MFSGSSSQIKLNAHVRRKCAQGHDDIEIQSTNGRVHKLQTTEKTDGRKKNKRTRTNANAFEVDGRNGTERNRTRKKKDDGKWWKWLDCTVSLLSSVCTRVSCVCSSFEGGGVRFFRFEEWWMTLSDEQDSGTDSRFSRTGGLVCVPDGERHTERR